MHPAAKLPKTICKATINTKWDLKDLQDLISAKEKELEYISNVNAKNIDEETAYRISLNKINREKETVQLDEDIRVRLEHKISMSLTRIFI
jgi:predicted transcriptional regulator